MSNVRLLNETMHQPCKHARDSLPRMLDFNRPLKSGGPMLLGPHTSHTSELERETEAECEKIHKSPTGLKSNNLC